MPVAQVLHWGKASEVYVFWAAVFSKGRPDAYLKAGTRESAERARSRRAIPRGSRNQSGRGERGGSGRVYTRAPTDIKGVERHCREAP